MSDIKYRIPNDTVAGARKPGNDMKKNASLPKMAGSPAMDQRDKGLGFNGQEEWAVRPSTNGRYAGNQHSAEMEGDNIRFAQMPNRKGNISDAGRVRAPATAGASKNPVESGGRSWTPSAGQNYRGNPDRIQDRQMPNRKGNKD